MSAVTGTSGIRAPADQDYGCNEHCILRSYSSRPASTAQDSSARLNNLPDEAAVAKQLYRPMYNWEIRILGLHPGKFGDPLEASLHLAVIFEDGNVILHEERTKTVWCALSYVWGEPVFDHRISCSILQRPDISSPQRGLQIERKEAECAITHNLHRALQRLRREDKVRYIWVDQLCINQNDLSERSSQVQKMLQIYQNAGKVFVWLGEEGPHTDLTLSAIKNELVVAAVNKNMKSDSRTQGSARITAVVKSLSCSSHFQVFILGLRDLLSRPWYNRLWIKQEVWAARQVDMICGGHSTPMATLKDLSNDLSALSSSHRDPFLDTQQAGRNREGQHVGEDPLQVLQRTSSSECRDPRDHVFGVIGMTSVGGNKSNGYRPRLAIEYSQTISQVYEGVISLIVQRRFYNVFLKLFGAQRTTDSAPIFGGQIEGDHIPSWCPNWGIPWKFLADDGDFDAKRRQELHAQPLKPARDTIEIAATFSRGVMRLRGATIGRIDMASQPKISQNSRYKCVKISLNKRIKISRNKSITMNSQHHIFLKHAKQIEVIVPNNVQLEDLDFAVVVQGSTAPFILRAMSDGHFIFATLALLASRRVEYVDRDWRLWKDYVWDFFSDDSKLETFEVK